MPRYHQALCLAHAGKIFDGKSGLQQWQSTLHVDVRAPLVAAHLAVDAMSQNAEGGAIVSVASAAGIFPMPTAPVYSAAKAGLVHFTRSAAKPLAAKKIRCAALCPQFVDTALVSSHLRNCMSAKYGSLLSTDYIADELLHLVSDPTSSGRIRVVLQNGRAFNWEPHFSKEAQQAMAAPPRVQQGHSGAAQTSQQAQRAHDSTPSARSQLPASFRRWEVTRLSHRFEEAVELATMHMPQSVPEGHVLVRRVAAGVNASDVNFTSGAYHGSRKAAQAALPFAAGFESVGIVEQIGPGSRAPLLSARC